MRIARTYSNNHSYNSGITLRATNYLNIVYNTIMEIKFVFGILSTIFTFVGLIPYFLNIHKKKIYPHNLSWLGWAFITLIGALAMLSGGGEWAVLILFANFLSCIVVVLFSIYKKVGVWSTTKYDYLFFVLGIIGIILWQIFNIPLLALLCCVIADLCFGIPTIIKAYKNPISENYLAWLACSIAGLLSIFALNSFEITESLYPLYLFIFDTTILSILLIRNKNILARGASF